MCNTVAIQTLLLSYLFAHKRFLNICAISCFTSTLEEIVVFNACILIAENIFSGFKYFLTKIHDSQRGGLKQEP